MRNNAEKTLTPRLVKKLWLAFILLNILMGASYVFVTVYFANKYYQATTQRVNSDVAKHLIEEKFRSTSPFLEDGSPNKALFDDVMHDMMAVNRGIEVYLLDKQGSILYSVVLDHSKNAAVQKVSLDPIQSFIESDGKDFVLGDDPRNMEKQKIFSAAPFSIDGRQGYIYIILAGKEFELISDNLLAQYFVKLGIGAIALTMLFAALIALLSIWFLTKNLRLISRTIRKFREGDLEARIENPEKSDIAVFAYSFNEMAETIAGNMDKMKSVDTLRRELIANVSHDLRTPLAVLKGYIETLQMKKDSLSDQEKENYLQIAHDNVDKMSNLINQLFEYSKLESEQILPMLEPFSITELAHDLVTKFKVIAEHKNIELKLEHLGENNMVFADVSLVERALQNLIENAIKFTETGGLVQLEITKSKDQVEIKVSDTGVGIPVRDQPYIFDRYKQVTKNPGKQGYGLGLAIVKKIMDLHNTTIHVLSSPNKGSSFLFTLPVYKA